VYKSCVVALAANCDAKCDGSVSSPASYCEHMKLAINKLKESDKLSGYGTISYDALLPILKSKGQSGCCEKEFSRTLFAKLLVGLTQA